MQTSAASDQSPESPWKHRLERGLCLPMMLVANFVIALYFCAIYASTTKRSRNTDLRTLVLLCAWVTTREKKSDEGKRQRGNSRIRGPMNQPNLSSIVPQTSTIATTTRRASLRPSLMTMYSFKRVYQRRHPSVVFLEQLTPEFPVDATSAAAADEVRSKAASSVKSSSSS